MDARVTTTAALEPTWTTTSFFPKTTTLPHLVRRKLNRMTPARCATTTASRATTRKRVVAIPIRTKTGAVRLPKVEANRASKTTASFVAAAVVVADVAMVK